MSFALVDKNHLSNHKLIEELNNLQLGSVSLVT